MVNLTKKTFGILALILSIGFMIELIFYWPDSGFDILYLIKLLAFIVSSASVFWLIFFTRNSEASKVSK